MAIPYLLDPNNRPGAQLFASPSAYTGGVLNAITPLPAQRPDPLVPNSMAAPGGIIQVPEEKPGILGRIGRGLANPAINQRLSALGAELLANSGYSQIPVTTGAGLGRGLQAMNQAGQAYDQMLGQQAAAALDKRMKEAQLKKSEREAAGQLDALKYQFGGAVITEQDGVKGFSIPVQNPQTGDISAKFVPVGSDILSRTTGLSAQDQATLDISTAGGKTAAQITAENALAPQTASARAQIKAAEAAAGKSGELTAAGDYEKAKQQPIDTANAQKMRDQLNSARNKVLEARKQADWKTTGFVGSMLRKVPGSDAFDLSKTLDTVKSNIGLDTLVTLKNAGGTLGAVSEKELELLLSKIASLEQAQSQDQFMSQLDDVLSQYDRTIGYIDTDLGAKYGNKGGSGAAPVKPAARQDLRSKYGL